MDHIPIYTFFVTTLFRGPHVRQFKDKYLNHLPIYTLIVNTLFYQLLAFNIHSGDQYELKTVVEPPTDCHCQDV